MTIEKYNLHNYLNQTFQFIVQAVKLFVKLTLFSKHFQLNDVHWTPDAFLLVNGHPLNKLMDH